VKTRRYTARTTESPTWSIFASFVMLTLDVIRTQRALWEQWRIAPLERIELWPTLKLTLCGSRGKEKGMKSIKN